MIKQIKDKNIAMLLPEEIPELNPKTMTRDDMLIAIGWNLYRDKLIKLLKLNKWKQ